MHHVTMCVFTCVWFFICVVTTTTNCATQTRMKSSSKVTSVLSSLSLDTLCPFSYSQWEAKQKVQTIILLRSSLRSCSRYLDNEGTLTKGFWGPAHVTVTGEQSDSAHCSISCQEFYTLIWLETLGSKSGRQRRDLNKWKPLRNWRCSLKVSAVFFFF